MQKTVRLTVNLNICSYTGASQSTNLPLKNTVASTEVQIFISDVLHLGSPLMQWLVRQIYCITVWPFIPAFTICPFPTLTFYLSNSYNPKANGLLLMRRSFRWKTDAIFSFRWSCHCCRILSAGWLAARPDKILLKERTKMNEKHFRAEISVVATLQACWTPMEQRPEAFDWFPATNTLSKERMINVQYQGRAGLYSPRVWLEF